MLGVYYSIPLSLLSHRFAFEVSHLAHVLTGSQPGSKDFARKRTFPSIHPVLQGAGPATLQNVSQSIHMTH